MEEPNDINIEWCSSEDQIPKGKSRSRPPLPPRTGFSKATSSLSSQSSKGSKAVSVPAVSSKCDDSVMVMVKMIETPLPMPPAILVPYPPIDSKLTQEKSPSWCSGWSTSIRNPFTSKDTEQRVPSPSPRLKSKQSSPIPSPTKSSPKMFSKTDKTYTVPASLVFGKDHPGHHKIKPSPPRNNTVGKTSMRALLPPDTHRMAASEKVKLDEILQMCADYERQIDLEQKEALKLHQLGQLMESTSSRLSENSNKVSSTPPMTQCSPNGTMATTPNRIITNGSLPREKRQMSPSPTVSPCTSSSLSIRNYPTGSGAPNTPTSPFLPASDADLRSVFGFDKTPETSEEPKTFKLQQPPTYRTGIRTTALSSISSESNYYQGGGEDTCSPESNPTLPRRKPFIMTGTIMGSSSPTTPQSPGSTVPRRPPRSKHDSDNDLSPDIQKPSQEASSRVLIGTTMLQGQQQKVSPLRSELEQLEIRRKHQVEVVSSSKQQLHDVEEKELEEIGELDLERSLLPAEPEAETDQVNKIKPRSGLFKIQEQRLSDVSSSRVSIGTTMLRGQQQKVSPLRNELEQLEIKRKCQVGIVSSLKQQLRDVEEKESEEIGELDLERSLLSAELEAETYQVKKIKSRLSLLRIQERRLSGVFEEWQKITNEKIKQAQDRMNTAELDLKRLRDEVSNASQEMGTSEYEGDNSSGTTLMDKLKYYQELVELEKKAFEDMEFHQMEEEVHKQTEREELLREISGLEREARKHESQLADLDVQQRQLLDNVRRDTAKLEAERRKVINRLEKERSLLQDIEIKIKELSRSHDGTKNVDQDSDSGNEEGDVLENLELDHNLKRLELLDKTQEEIEKLSQAVVKLCDNAKANSSSQSTRPSGTVGGLTLLVLQQQKRVAEELNRVIKSMNAPLTSINKVATKHIVIGATNSLNSAGSEEESICTSGSTSDIHTESLSTSTEYMGKATPSPTAHMNGKAPTNGIKDTSSSNGKGEEEILLSINRDNEISRPVSEASSVWDGAESQLEVKKRQNFLKQQRPLTRYLPIRGEHLDLRHHIETAGHPLEMIFPAVIVDSLTCRGYLHKLGGGKRSSCGKFSSLSNSWNKRWFIFDRSKKTLVYYSDKSETKAEGGVYFSAIEEVYVDHLNAVKSPNPKVTFAMKTFERTYYLMAPSPEAMRVWVDVIFTGAEGYQEFLYQ